MPAAGQRLLHHRRCRSNTNARTEQHHLLRQQPSSGGSLLLPTSTSTSPSRTVSRCHPRLAAPNVNIIDADANYTSSSDRASAVTADNTRLLQVNNINDQHARHQLGQQHGSCTCNLQRVSSDSRQHPAPAGQQHQRPARQQRHRLGQQHGSSTCNIQSVSSDRRQHPAPAGQQHQRPERQQRHRTHHGPRPRCTSR